MNKLVIDTANNELMLVLKLEDELFYKKLNSKAKHNETMLPLIDELLKENNISIHDIDEFGVIVGPGSFTGIRVGIATIKAFRDVLNVCAWGINNLDYLFALADNENMNINVVAIKGSRDSYFVARRVNGVVYKYERNLTLEELSKIVGDGKVGMFDEDENLNVYKLSSDPKILLQCMEKSDDTTLLPIYYQLSQAENEKLKRGKLDILEATKLDVDSIYKIESESIRVNTLSSEDILRYIESDSYAVYKAVLNDLIVGFIILELTDEVNIISIAVDKYYRNIGLATSLINSAERLAREKNISTISLEVSENNITAYLLYEKLGFVKRRIRTKYYSDGSDCIEMIKNLTNE